MSSKTINILCATDDNYVPYCGIMLTSVFLNNKRGTVDVYLMIDKPLSDKNVRKFRQLEKQYGNKINFVMVDKAALGSASVRGMDYWTIAIYYRLFAAELLPLSVDKVLYLDCDIIVTGNLEHLWKMDWTNYAAGVVPDIFNDADRNYTLLKYDKELGYFNSGVIFMNLDYWRKNKTGEKCVELLNNNYNNDQDLLNDALKDCKKNLPLTYNFQIQFLSKYFRSEVFSESFRKEVDDVELPLIVHYAAPVKPWRVDYYGMPYGRLWHKYKRQSLWRHMSDIWPEGSHFKLLVKRYLLWPLNIMRPTTIYIDDITI